MKKTMKSIMLVAAMATAFTGCTQKEIAEPVIPENGYSYIFNVETMATKAVLGDKAVAYEAGDQLGVYVGTTVNVASTVDITTTPVTVSVTAAEALVAGDVLYAYYPYSSVNASASATAVTMTIPAAQTQTGTSYDADAMPMAAVPYTVTSAVEAGTATSVGDIYMCNLASVAEFNVYSAEVAGKKIQSVSFESETAIAGNFTTDLTAITDGMTSDRALEGLASTAVTVAVNSSAVVGADKENATKIYMVVAPGQHKGVVKVRTEDALYTFPVETAVNFQRAHVKPLGLNLATASREAAIKIEWVCDGMGQVRSNSPAVDPNGNVYMTTGKDAKLYKVNADGTLAWSYDMGFTGDNASSPSMEADGSVIYAGGGGSGTGTYYAFNPDGTVKWQFTKDKFFGNGSTPAPNINQVTAAVGDKCIYIGNAGTAGSVLSIDKSIGERVAYVSGKADGTGGPTGGVYSGMGLSKNGYLAWHCNYGTYLARQADMDTPSKVHDTYGSYAPYVHRYSYSWAWKSSGGNVAFLPLNGEDHVASFGVETTSAGVHKVHIICAPTKTGETEYTGYQTTWTYKHVLTDVAKQDQGGLAVGPQNEVIVSLKRLSDNTAGLYAVNTEGNMAWSYYVNTDVASTCAVDAAGNIHFVTDNPGWYYIIKPDYENKTATLVAKINLYDLTVASGIDVGNANASRMWSSIAIGADGKMYVGASYHKDKADYNGAVVCLSYEGCTGPGDTPWPMKGANAQRTSNQMK